MPIIQSAVRIPTPEPQPAVHDIHPSRKRYSSPSPRPSSPRRRRTISPRPNDESPPASSRKDGSPRRPAPEADVTTATTSSTAAPVSAPPKPASGLNGRNGGVYIPPAKLRAMQAEIKDKNSQEYQRIAWDALKKSINGLINKVNVSNIKFIAPELFGENLIRGRGLFCRSIMKAQTASLPFTPVYAALVAIVNTKLPQIGELLAHRLVNQFRKSFRRNDKAVCLSSTMFLAQLINQQVIHEMLAAQMLLLLLHKPTDDSVEIAVALTKEVGQHLEEMDSKIAMAVFDQFRSILHEADIDKRVQYMIEVLFQVRKEKYKDHPAIREELDLVEEEDQIIHQVSLDDPKLQNQDGLNIFKFDPDYEENEKKYAKLKAEILGDDSDEEGSGSEGEGSAEDDDGEGEDDVDEDEDEESEEAQQRRAMEIKDQTNAELTNLRKKIYLTIKSSGGVEECCHKLLRINVPEEHLPVLTAMVVDCAYQERTYNKFYGLIGQQLCTIHRLWKDLFEDDFMRYYDTIHRFETSQIRIIAQFFAYVLACDAISWRVMSVIRLSVEETTSSSRIFIKILFEELVAELGMRKLAAHFADEEMWDSFDGILSPDDPRVTRFGAIGLAALAAALKKELTELIPDVPMRD